MNDTYKPIDEATNEVRAETTGATTGECDDTADFAAKYGDLTPEHKVWIRATIDALHTLRNGGTVDLHAFRAAVPLTQETASIHARIEAGVK